MKILGNITASTDAVSKGYVDAIIPTQTGNTGKYLTTDGTIASWASVSASASLSGLTAAMVANTIDNTNYKQIWQWALTADNQTGLKLTESAASTGGSGSQSILEVTTTSLSTTANPFMVKCRGYNIMYVSAGGHVYIQSAGAAVANDPGTPVSIFAGGGSGTGVGGTMLLQGGNGGTAGSACGLLTISGGDATGGNGNGGNILITGGAKNGSGTIGTITLTGQVILTSALGIAYGGTGATTANAGLNALLPSQASNASRFLKTDATNTSWAALTEADVANLTTDLAAKAPTASPTFTGVPAAPTAAVATNTTQLATTAFANSAVNSAINQSLLALTNEFNLIKRELFGISDFEMESWVGVG